MSEMVTYWFSKEHQEHMYDCDVTFGSLMNPDKREPRQNLVEINGVWHKYSTCRRDERRNIEPYDDALRMFPDYKIVGEADGFPIRITSKDNAEEFLRQQENRQHPAVAELERMFLL